MNESLGKKSSQTPKTKWRKTITIGDDETSTEVREIENGYIIKVCKSYRDKDGYQYEESEKFSETNPLEGDSEATTSKPIKDLYKELFNEDFASL